MESKKILLFGGSGFLGSTVKSKFTDDRIIAPTHASLDLLNINHVYSFIEKSQPDVIVYTAGVVKIDLAEKYKYLAFILNHQIPGKIAKFVKNKNIQLIYISTDAVFDGYKNKYLFSETDIPKAKSIYGLSKLQGEEIVLSTNQSNCVIRLITLYGIEYKKPNFVTRFIEALKKNQSYVGIVDQVQNPLYVNVAAEAISFIIKHREKGIYHLGALDWDSNYNFLLRVASRFNLDSRLIKKTTFNNFRRDKSGFRKKKSVLLGEKFVKVSENKILQTIESSIKQLYESTK